ncbi:GtrA family protein [Paraclostridium sordellii]|uniref:GtrA family protein n=1 Tax=Paraclostridium sordellii TaxID=1505 RepID=UPI0005E6EA8C|nr:GtrA family protein [Paeniclostridium sordellii]CEN26690.1 GtrA family protein [[Clostridium] sordellii] [Paeniclostridium sordellii]
MKFIKRLLLNTETLSYLFFGVLTTVVNYTAFVGALFLLGEEKPLLANTIAFILATFFAYITNKIWVFKINNWKIKNLIAEIVSFSGVRIVSFFFEQIGLSIFISVFNVGEYAIFGLNGVIAAKIILSFIVVVVNYALSKFFIFNKA